jgi:hypothetical protein
MEPQNNPTLSRSSGTERCLSWFYPSRAATIWSGRDCARVTGYMLIYGLSLIEGLAVVWCYAFLEWLLPVRRTKRPAGATRVGTRLRTHAKNTEVITNDCRKLILNYHPGCSAGQILGSRNGCSRKGFDRRKGLWFACIASSPLG